MKVKTMKVKFFIHARITGQPENLDKLEEEITDWMSKEKIKPSDLFNVCQTEDGVAWTVSIWYFQFRTVQD